MKYKLNNKLPVEAVVYNHPQFGTISFVATVPSGIELDLELVEEEKSWPQEGDEYWYVTEEGIVDSCTFIQAEKCYHDHGNIFDNIFRTKQEAEHAAEKIKELLASLKK
jgi:hypothetical protein